MEQKVEVITAMEQKPEMSYKERALSELSGVLKDAPEEGLIDLRRKLFLGLVQKGTWKRQQGHNIKQLGCVIAEAFSGDEDADKFELGMIHTHKVGTFTSAWDSGQLTKEEVIGVIESEMTGRGLEIF